MGGIFASLRQATGYQSEVILTLQEAGNQTFIRLGRTCPPCMVKKIKSDPKSSERWTAFDPR